MPQAMRVNTAQPGRKVKQLHTHGYHNPCHHHTRHNRPQTARPLITRDTEPTPQQILHYPSYDIRRHIIRVVPAHALEIAHMAHIQRNAKQCPRAKHTPPSRTRPIESEDANRRIVHAVQNICSRSEVIQLLSQLEIARVEDRTKDPASDAHMREDHIERPQGIASGNELPDLDEAIVVRIEVPEGEEHAKGLLHAEEAVEGPFSVELHHGLMGGEALRCDNVLARVVAFGGAVPEEESAEKSWAQTSKKRVNFSVLQNLGATLPR